jgi:hypothetical protein
MDSVSILGFEKQGGFLSKNENLLHLLIFFGSWDSPLINFGTIHLSILGQSKFYQFWDNPNFINFGDITRVSQPTVPNLVKQHGCTGWPGSTLTNLLA